MAQAPPALAGHRRRLPGAGVLPAAPVPLRLRTRLWTSSWPRRRRLTRARWPARWRSRSRRARRSSCSSRSTAAFIWSAARCAAWSRAFRSAQVSLANGESTFFVLRKLIGGAEYGWIPANGGLAGWQAVGRRRSDLLEHEERLPLYPTAPKDGRTLLFGYVPVSSKETYSVGPAVLAQLTGEPASSLTDPRADEFQSKFIDQATVLVGMPASQTLSAATTQIRLQHVGVLSAGLMGVAYPARCAPGCSSGAA